MAQTTQQTSTSLSVPSSPVDDATYDLLQALTSKLEAIEAYARYQDDDDTGVFGQLRGRPQARDDAAGRAQAATRGLTPPERKG